MKKGGKVANVDRTVGHVPGIAINSRFYSRAELSCVGMHGPPVAGIDYLGVECAGAKGGGIPSYAVGVVVAGWYEDDGDEGDTLIYTGGVFVDGVVVFMFGGGWLGVGWDGEGREGKGMEGNGRE
jgi:hypothetical protein